MRGVNFYRQLKPVLNKLSQLNVWDSLYVIRQYLNNSFKNYDLDSPNFSDIESHKNCPIPAYLIDFMILASLRYSSTLRSAKSLRQLKVRCKITPLVYDVYEKARYDKDENILIWLKAYMLNQLKMQHPDFFANRVYKYHYLYSTPSLVKLIQSKLGITKEKYFKLVILYYFLFSQKFCYVDKELERSIVADGSQFTTEEAEMVLFLLCKDIGYIKENISVDFSQKMFLCHNDAIHVRYPIIKDGNMLYSVVPTYILNAGVEGLQFHLNLKSKDNVELNNELATRFEDYVGEQLEYFSHQGKFKYIKEFTYRKGQNKTSDWIVYDKQCVMFLDCKLKKLPISSILETELSRDDLKAILVSGKLKKRGTIEELKKQQTSSLVKDIIELGVDLGKVLCCYCDWKEGKIGKIPPYREDITFCATLLTLEETFCGALEIMEFIEEIAYRYVYDKKTVNLERVKSYIISSATFDNDIPEIAQQGIYAYIKDDKFEEHGKKSEQNGFLKEGFDKFLNK